MIKYWFALLLIATTGNAFPQCYFHNTYDYIQDIDGGTVISQSSAGGFIAVGKSYIPMNYDATYAVKLDNCGNVLWQSLNLLSSGTGGEDTWGSFESDNESSLFLFGNLYDHSESSSSSFIFKLNSNGDSTYFKIINHGYNDWCKSALK
ncbi:MAG TPA: hypothetical protein VEA37_02325, partial [Flavobacterium sp.]|nr:hypothetical protein [Flavobacterium sp.]